MAISFDVEAELRVDLGKGASRRLRRRGRVPAVIYGGSAEPQSVTLVGKDIVKHLTHEAFYSHILRVRLGGKTQKAVLRDVQRHPARGTPMHLDFQRVADTEVIRMHVPLHFLHEDSCIGVKAGGRISHAMTDLEVACQAKDLPEYIEVDLAELDKGQSLHISDLSLPAGVQSVVLAQGAEHDRDIVTVHGQGGAAAAEEETEQPAD